LDAIRANRSEHLVIRLVLGPDRDRTVVRLESMLVWALSHRIHGRPDPTHVAMLEMASPFRVPLSPGQAGILSQEIVHVPMYAEDFLTVFDRAKL
jgi:hypothetical protein